MSGCRAKGKRKLTITRDTSSFFAEINKEKSSILYILKNKKKKCIINTFLYKGEKPSYTRGLNIAELNNIRDKTFIYFAEISNNDSIEQTVRKNILFALKGKYSNSAI